jgi:hypothetical protein
MDVGNASAMTHTKHHGAGGDQCEDEAGSCPPQGDELPR